MNCISNVLIPKGLNSRRRLDGHLVRDCVRVITLREFSGDMCAGRTYASIANQQSAIDSGLRSNLWRGRGSAVVQFQFSCSCA